MIGETHRPFKKNFVSQRVVFLVDGSKGKKYIYTGNRFREVNYTNHNLKYFFIHVQCERMHLFFH